jgi:putative transposase
MSSRYKAIEHQLPHHVTFTVIHWIDVFTREAYRQIAIESLQFCIEKKGLILHAWVIMPNHIHLILSMQEGFSIPDLVRDFKKFTSRKIVTAIDQNAQESRKVWMMRAFSIAGARSADNEQYQFWQPDYHPIELNSRERLIQRLEYLHNNPVKAGIVQEPQHYLYSSAGDYSTHVVGILPLVKIEDVFAK